VSGSSNKTFFRRVVVLFEKKNDGGKFKAISKMVYSWATLGFGCRILEMRFVMLYWKGKIVGGFIYCLF
jgi:hypothetical protein